MGVELHPELLAECGRESGHHASGCAEWREIARPGQGGLEPGQYLWLDVFRGALLEPKEGKLTLELPPASCQVVSVWPRASHPQFLGTNRHLTQGAVDIAAVAWGAKTLRLRGTSRVVGGDPYRVRAYVPDGYRAVTEGVEQYGSLAVLTVITPSNAKVKWELKFRRKWTRRVA